MSQPHFERGDMSLHTGEMKGLKEVTSSSLNREPVVGLQFNSVSPSTEDNV